jgi:acetylornithine deacetylase
MTTMTTTATTLPTRPARDQLLAHLADLVACDTRNPPRDPAPIGRLFSLVSDALGPGFSVELRDLGDGCRWLSARRGGDGRSRREIPLVNVHIDTVPKDAGWTRDPFQLDLTTIDGELCAVGLGACDIKGAVAAFLVAAARTNGPIELLLTSDEEAGSSRCVQTFVAEHDVVGRMVLVAEPTQGRAVVAHRGIGTAVITFNGVAGHASHKRAAVDSAVAEAVRFGAAALELAAADDQAIRLNLGRIEGGTKANMIASSCLLRFGVRPPPELAADAVLARLQGLLTPGRATFERGFLAPALPAPWGERDIATARATSRARANALGLLPGDDVDFFTEAAFFSAAGADAVVFGPGDIAQAHTPDEWVRVVELEAVAAAYAAVMGGPASAS